VKTILVVDDNPDVRAALADVLELLGCRVETASNGREALHRLGQARPDLILLDWMMPVMDGREFGVALRRQPEGAHIPVVLTSAAPGAEQVGRDIQAQAVLPKPFRMDDLARLVELLDHRT
jgi:CheY-like chemotaxis protein